jgi:FAD/FMN-containing dehydrogenase
MTLPFFSGLTLGGILATASHGTGDRVASALVDMVVEAVWVDAAGTVGAIARRAGGRPHGCPGLRGDVRRGRGRAAAGLSVCMSKVAGHLRHCCL